MGPANRHAANDVSGGWGNYTPRPMPGTQTPCRVPAVPAPARNARQFPLHPRLKLSRRNAGVTAWAGRAATPRDNPGTSRPGRAPPDRPPRSGHVFRMPPATVQPITSKLIYINARASAARFSARCRWQGSSPGRFRTGLVGAQRGLRTNLFASSWESVPRCGPHIGAGPGCPVAGLVAAMRPKSAGR